jgi:hypothetical protein
MQAASRRQDHAPREITEDALRAVARMEAEVTAALRRVGPGEIDNAGLIYVGRQMCTLGQVIEAEVARRLMLAAAYRRGEAAGFAKAAARRKAPPRRSPALTIVPATRAG